MRTEPMSESLRLAYCRQHSLDPETTTAEYIDRLNRFGFLSGFTLRTDAEEAEVQALAIEFKHIEWPVHPRTYHERRLR